MNKIHSDLAKIMDFGQLPPKPGPGSVIIPSLRPWIVCFPYSPEANSQILIKSRPAQNKVNDPMNWQIILFMFEHKK